MQILCSIKLVQNRHIFASSHLFKWEVYTRLDLLMCAELIRYCVRVQYKKKQNKLGVLPGGTYGSKSA